MANQGDIYVPMHKMSRRKGVARIQWERRGCVQLTASTPFSPAPRVLRTKGACPLAGCHVFGGVPRPERIYCWRRRAYSSGVGSSRSVPPSAVRAGGPARLVSGPETVCHCLEQAVRGGPKRTGARTFAQIRAVWERPRFSRWPCRRLGVPASVTPTPAGPVCHCLEQAVPIRP